jgi:hypothetical protein
MTETSPRAVDLEAVLAEIDRRLREIQDELATAGARQPSLADERPPTPANDQPPPPRGRSGPLAAALRRAAKARRPEPGTAGAEATDTGGTAATAPGAPGTAERPTDPSSDRALEQARRRLQDVQHQVDTLLEVRDRLHASIVELLDRYTSALAQPGEDAGAFGSAGSELTVSAGPFLSLDSLRAFERELATVPGVRDVTRRGFEGATRVILDIELTPASHSSRATP